MAKVSKKDDSEKKPKLNRKKQQTVRERAAAAENSRPKRIRSSAGRVATPFKKARVFGKREYHMPLPENRTGKVLGKRVNLVPKFFREAWREIRQVTWPSARETFRLTMAVFIFAVVFAAIVGVLDYGLDKLFREVIIGN